MHSTSHRIATIAWGALWALLILAFAQGVWGALLVTNLKISPSVPWAVVVMAPVLWAMWQYLGGRWWPRRTSATRRCLLRANRVSQQTMAWSLLAGVLSIVALAGYWIVFFDLVKMPPNVLPEMTKYPKLTLILFGIMASFVSPFSEEAAFRGYFQMPLEQEFRGVTAVAISSVLFSLAHLTQGLYWPKLLVYLLAGLVFGTIAFLTQSTWPAVPVHILADMSFFALVWPFDAARRLIWDVGADAWFYLHVAQAVIFSVLAILAFRRLAAMTRMAAPESSIP